MKRLFLLLILGTVSLTSNSQWSECKKEIVLRMFPKSLIVYLEKCYTSDNKTYSQIIAKCRLNFENKLFPKKSWIYINNIDTLKADILFQNLYDWIKKIEDFSINPASFGDTIIIAVDGTDNRHSEPNLVFGTGSLLLIAHTSRILISPRTNDFYRYTNIRLKEITEFKNRLLKYTKKHNISIL